MEEILTILVYILLVVILTVEVKERVLLVVVVSYRVFQRFLNVLRLTCDEALVDKVTTGIYPA